MGITRGEASWDLGLWVLCSAAFWWWCWLCWVRWQKSKDEEARRGSVAPYDSEGIREGSSGGGSERDGLTRRALSSCCSGSRGGDGGGGGGDGRRIPKGSTGWPLIGETLEFIACGYTSRPTSFMEKRRRLYGRVFRSHLLGRPVVISTDAEVNWAVLQNHGFMPWYPRSVVELHGESSILRKDGAHHRRVHGLIATFLKSPAAKALVADDMERCMLQSLRRWNEGQLLYIQDEAKEITLQVLVKVLMGMDPGEELDFLKREFEEFIQGLVCLPINLPGTRLYKSLKARERILNLVRKIIEDRISGCGRSSVEDVVDILLSDIDMNGKQQASIDSICGNVIEMMIPGDHSAPVVMTLAVKFLSDSPLALQQLTVENMQLKREKTNRHEPYAWTDYMSLTFTQHVINETLRMGNVINCVWRKATKDMEIKGYLIPKDWCILTSFSSIHFDQDIYSNPYEFNPWRWQVKGSSASYFTPFGGGVRLCPAQELARLKISIFLHHLVTSYSWVAEEDAIVSFPLVKMKKKMPIRISAISI